jgi:hypothetical protein
MAAFLGQSIMTIHQINSAYVEQEDKNKQEKQRLEFPKQPDPKRARIESENNVDIEAPVVVVSAPIPTAQTSEPPQVKPGPARDKEGFEMPSTAPARPVIKPKPAPPPAGVRGRK